MEEEREEEVVVGPVCACDVHEGEREVRGRRPGEAAMEAEEEEDEDEDEEDEEIVWCLLKLISQIP